MELDWTTVALEVFNFLVLVWVLTRLLYRPVLKVIADRKTEIQKTLSDAEAQRNEAITLRAQYENRQEEWNREKESVRDRMMEEVDAERRRLLDELRASLQEEREKTRAVNERRLTDLTRQAEHAAIAQGGRFASRLLTRLAGADLEARLVTIMLEDLSRLPDERRQAIRTAHTRGGEPPIIVASAHGLSQLQRKSLVDAMESLLGGSVSWEWRQDPQLLAGIRLSLGPWVLGANLQDELKAFAEAALSVSIPHAS